MEVTGVLLAGGRSSRFGSDKALALVGGRTFITLAYGLLKPVCGTVVISGRDHHSNIEGVQCLADINPGGGPMSGISTAVRKLQCQWMLFIPCDMPLLTPEILEMTISEGALGRSVVWLWPDGKIQPFPMLLNREDASRAIDFLGEDGGMSIKSMLLHIPYTSIPITSDKLRLFSNINTQSEFENLKL